MRIYISSTTKDLAYHRKAVIDALQRSGHTPVCMEYHPPGDQAPKDECLKEVRDCDAYVGIFAWCYGFIPPKCKISITELEYREALNCRIPTLIFLLDDKAEWKAEFKDTGFKSHYIKRLRDELQKTKWIGYFSGREDLVIQVLEAVYSLTNKEVIIKSHEESNPVPVPIPERFIRHFQDRNDELSELRQYILDKNLRLVLICGRGGIGKTTLVVKMIWEMISSFRKETSSNPDKYERIVYISLGETCYRTPDRIIELISRTMDRETAVRIKGTWNQAETSLRDRLAMLFHGPLSQHRCLIVLDNLESVLDNEDKILLEYAPLRQFIEAILEHDHFLKLIATSRQGLILSPDITIDSVGKWIQIDLDKGLPEKFAIMLLRELDYNGLLGIQEAKDEILKNIVCRCSCIPRTLETLVATLLQRPTWTLDTLLTNEPFFSRLIENPARELFTSLSSDQERLVIQVLAVYGKPVPGIAVRSVLPTLPVDEILDRLFHRFVVKHNHGIFWLHSLDMQYAYNQIPELGSTYCRQSLHKMAADFYKSIPCPVKGKRSSLEEVVPILDTIEQLLSANQVEDSAKTFIENGLHEDLYWWGYFILLSDLCHRFLRLNISSNQKIILNVLLGKIQRNLGNLQDANKTYEMALLFLDSTVDPKTEISLYIALGDINYYLGKINDSLLYHRKAEQLLIANPDPSLQSENTGDMGNTMLGAGKFREALELYEKAIGFSRDAKNRIFEGIWNGNLGNLYISLLDIFPDAYNREMAISYLINAIEISIETADRRHESHWNGVLGNLYRNVADFESAERHLKKALSIAYRIGYGRMINTQVRWFTMLYNEWIQHFIKNHDYDKALETVSNFPKVIDEIGIADLNDKLNIDYIRFCIYRDRGAANAINGKIEEAISDYSECVNLDPENSRVSLNRAEILIRAGRYCEARISLESINIQDKKTEDKIIHAWLMCHTLNLEDLSFSSYSKVLEDYVTENIQLNYNVKDIELYLTRLDRTKFSEAQITNAWGIQKLIKKSG